MKLFDVFLYCSAFSQSRVCDIDSVLKSIVFLVKSFKIFNEENFFSTKWPDFALYMICFYLLDYHWTGVFFISMKNIRHINWFSMHDSVVVYKFNNVFLINFSSSLSVVWFERLLLLNFTIYLNILIYKVDDRTSPPLLRNLDHPQSCSFKIFLVILDHHYTWQLV